MGSKKNGAASPREGSATAVREAARSGVPERATSPERAKRRTFTAEYKLRIVREADGALASGVEGAVGELLRREGLYSSHLTEWRSLRDAGELAGLTPKKRGRKSHKSPLADEVARLERELARVKDELHKANTVIDVQKKLAALLGEALPVPTEEDFARAPERFRPGRPALLARNDPSLLTRNDPPRGARAAMVAPLCGRSGRARSVDVGSSLMFA
ncbi:MAG: transposase [Deltaproteobacteria bacterium]|nr:transposase [Deltaproteobacteria bacterium]